MRAAHALNEENRRLILDCARELVFQKGFRGVTVDDILSAARITKGKFFHYFSSKDELFEELIREAVSSPEYPDYRVVLDECPARDPFEQLLFLVDRALVYHRKGPPAAIRLCLAATFFFSPDSDELRAVRRRVEGNMRVVERLLTACVGQDRLPASCFPKVLAMFPALLGIGGNVLGILFGKSQVSYNALAQFRGMLVTLRGEQKGNA